MGKAMVDRLAPKLGFSLEGCLLVAAPKWQSPTFARSVCLVVHHSPERSIGIVLNRGLDGATSELWKHLAGSGEEPMRRDVVHFGGPHSGPVIAVHNCQKLAEFTSAEGVYFAAQLDHLQALLKTEEEDCALKVIVGQADWEAGKLDREFSEGKWLPLPVTSELVFADQGLMWPRAMRKIGDYFVSSVTGAVLPPHAQAN